MNTKMGINANIIWSTSQADNQLSLAALAGASSVRFDFNMSHFQQTQGVYNFAKFETLVSLCEKYGLSVLALMSMHSTPTWSNGGHGDFVNYPPTAESYQNHCYQISKYFGNRITLYEMGNEPDLTSFWQPQQSYQAYTTVMKAGYTGLKSGNPNCIAMTAGLSGLAYNGTNHGGFTEFITGIYAEGGKNYFDAVGIHIYQGGTDQSVDWSRVIDPIREVMDNNGDTAKKIYMTERGFYTGTASGALTEAQQSTAIMSLYTPILTGDYQDIPTAWYFGLVDNGTTLSDSESNYGIVHASGYTTPFSKKPSFTTYQSLSSGTYNPTRIPKNLKNCIDFSKGGVVKAGNSNPFTGTFYISMWVKWKGINGSYQHLFAKRDSYGSTTMMFDLALLNTTGVIIRDTGLSYKQSSSKFPINQWVPFTYVYGTSGEYYYIDGDMVYSTTKGTLGSGTKSLMTIGACQNPAIESFNGKIDEVVIGTGEPTWYDVINMHRNFTYTNKVINYKFDDPSSYMVDSSGNGNDGTKVNGLTVSSKTSPAIYTKPTTYTCIWRK